MWVNLYVEKEKEIVECTWGGVLDDGSLFDGAQNVGVSDSLEATNTPYGVLVALGNGSHDIVDTYELAAQIMSEGVNEEELQLLIDELENQ